MKQRKRFTRSLLSVLFAFMMVVSMLSNLPGMTMQVHADSPFVKEPYNLILNPNCDGSSPESIPVNKDDFLNYVKTTADTMSQNPPEGRYFYGWYEKDPDTGELENTEFDFDAFDTSTMTDDVTIYAKWLLEKAEITKAPVANSLIYSGSAQTLVSAGEVDSGEMQYALGDETEATESFSSTIPAETNVGTYYVWYKAVGYAHTENTEPACVEVKINPVDKTKLNYEISAAEAYYNSIKDETLYSEVASALGTAIEEVKLNTSDENVDEATINSNKTAIIQARADAMAGKKEADDSHKVKITKTDMAGNIIEGAQFELSRTDGKTLDNVSVIGANDKVKEKIKAFINDDNDNEENNDKSVEITLNGKQSFTLSGTTLNHVTVNGVLINESNDQNIYTYSGTVEDKLAISGMYDGIYVVTLDDGTEYIISCDKKNKEISQIDVRVKPKESDDVADLKDNTAIISTDKRYISFTDSVVDITSIADGEYVLRELYSPNGYSKVESEYVFVIENGNVTFSYGDTSAVVENGNEITIMDDISELDFYKFYDYEEDTTPDDTSEGSEMKLTFKKASDKAVNVIDGVDTLEVGESVTWNTNNENPKTLRGLMDGEYLFEEIKGPVIYNKAESRTVFVEDGAIALKIGNHTISTRPYTHLLSEKKDAIVIDKKALGAKELPEKAGVAKFTLAANDENADLKGTVVNGSEITESTDKITFDGNKVSLVGLADGVYTLIEDTAPIGYDVVSEFTFKVENEIVTNVGSVTNGRIYIENDGKTLVIEDAPIITIDKKALGAEEIPEEAGKTEFTLNVKTGGIDLTGVVIGEGEDAIKVEAGVTSVKFESNSANIKGLKDGTYSLVEDIAPLGYSVVAEFEFEVENGLVKNVQAVTKGKTSVSADGKTLTVEDAPFLYINKKVLGNEEIPAEAGSATFVLAVEEEGKTLEGITINDGEALDELTSVEFTGNATKFEGLRDGTYSLEETEAPDGFTTVSKFTFEIKNGLMKNVKGETDGDAVVSEDGKVLDVFDTKSVIYINKKVLGNEEIPVEAGSATFVLAVEDEGKTLEGININDGEALGKLTSVEFIGNGTKFAGLRDGKYSLEEKEAPIGYKAVPKFTFDIENGIVKNVTEMTDGDAIVSEDGKTLTVEDPCYAIPADVSANSRVYDGTQQPLVNITGEAVDGIMNYALVMDNENVPSEGWSTSIPAATKVGTYYVWYKAEGTDNKVDSVPEKIVVEIKECPHTKFEIRDAKYPTCTDKGYEGDKYCLNCNTMLEKGKDIEASDHKYGEPQYVWSDDGKSCVATAICSTDTTHKLSEEAVITSKVKTPPTTTEKGITTYTATFKNDVFKTQTKDIADIPVEKNSGNDSESDPNGSGNGKYSSEWINGKWYDADGSQTYESTLSWKCNATGWWVEDSAGWYPQDQWQKIDGIWYFFKPDGYMASTEYYYGYWFNADGSWDSQYFLSWKCNATGWWVEDISGWWPSSQWLKIDGSWYYFDADGYMVTNQYVDGYWIGADGVCQ